MSCEHRHDEINQLIDGSLDPAARRDLEGHLRTCDACAEMADDLRRVRALGGFARAAGAACGRVGTHRATDRGAAPGTAAVDGPRAARVGAARNRRVPVLAIGRRVPR